MERGSKLPPKKLRNKFIAPHGKIPISIVPKNSLVHVFFFYSVSDAGPNEFTNLSR